MTTRDATWFKKNFQGYRDVCSAAASISDRAEQRAFCDDYLNAFAQAAGNVYVYSNYCGTTRYHEMFRVDANGRWPADRADTYAPSEEA